MVVTKTIQNLHECNGRNTRTDILRAANRDFTSFSGVSITPKESTVGLWNMSSVARTGRFVKAKPIGRLEGYESLKSAKAYCAQAALDLGDLP